MRDEVKAAALRLLFLLDFALMARQYTRVCIAMTFHSSDGRGYLTVVKVEIALLLPLTPEKLLNILIS